MARPETTVACQTRNVQASFEAAPLLPQPLRDDASIEEQDRSVANVLPPAQSPPEPHSSGERPRGPHEILVYVIEHDREARIQADLLVKILPRAGWEVVNIIAGPLPPHCGPGVTFAAPPAVSATQLARTFNTLSEAGFAVTLHLDPSRRANETMVMVVPIVTAVAAR